jgi:hypothetical protein
VPGLIRCAAQRFGVDPQTALRVARCESGELYWPWANSNGNYGTFQQRGIYWLGRVHTFLRSEWFNAAQWERIPNVPRGAYVARANILLSARMAKALGWGHWSCY